MTSRFSLFLFILIAFFSYSQNLQLDSLEQSIIKENRAGRYMTSQKKLSDLLLRDRLTKEERAYLLYLLAATYRSVGDYPMCIENLNKSMTLAKDFPADNPLKMRIDYELAFAYFDSNDYVKARIAMDHIYASNYTNASPENRAYLLMQEGYLLLKNKKVDAAEARYSEALKLMKQSTRCNLPVVYTKLMSLYSLKHNVAMAENLYQKSLKVCDSCNILKYKIFTVSEMERMYRENKMFAKAYSMASKLDSLRKLENIDTTVSEMHITDKAYVEKEQSLKERTDVTYLIFGMVILVALSILAVLYFYRKSANMTKVKTEVEEELEQVKSNYDLAKQSKEAAPAYYFFLESSDLTDRQKELLIHMADGLSNREIGEKLFITENTVKYHIKNIYAILKIKDRKEFFQKLRNN